MNNEIETHYLDGFQYTDDHLDFFFHAEGYVNVIEFEEFNYVYTYKDHLGNIRLRYALDPDTDELTILEEDHYYPYGLKHNGYNSNHLIFEREPSLEVVLTPVTPLEVDKFKYKFGGKEWQNEMDLNYYDFGARNYDPALGRWMNVDPLAEKAPDWTPYRYGFNNPVRYTDPTGMFEDDHIDVTKNDDGTYRVVGGEANSDKNIYVVDGNRNRTGEVVGEMLTEYSFHDDSGNAIEGAIIDLNDQSGQNFFNDEIKNIGLLEYMGNAQGGEDLDFKTRDLPDGLTRQGETQYHYRGMSFEGKVASARDVGNYAAGYVAGKHGFNWGTSRFAFDALETKQTKGTGNTVLFYPFNRVREGQPTQSAQREGHNAGSSISREQRARTRELRARYQNRKW